jgi:predicted RNA-binding protein with PIN domain
MFTALPVKIGPGAVRSSRLGALSKKSDPGESSESQPMHVVESTPRKELKRTAFRRKRSSDEDWQARQETLRRESERQEQHLLKGLPGNDESNRRTILLVDAYNIMNASPSIKALLYSIIISDSSLRLQIARGEMEKRMRAYAAAADVDLQLVYDALGGHNRGKGAAIMEKLDDRVSVVFCFSEEADSYIVREAQKLKKSGWGRIEVVSRDQRVVMESSDLDDFVIYPIDSDQFIRDIEDPSRVASRNLHLKKATQVELLQSNQLQASAASLRRELDRDVIDDIVPTEAEELRLLWELERITSKDEQQLLDPILLRQSWRDSQESSDDEDEISKDLNDLFSNIS